MISEPISAEQSAKKDSLPYPENEYPEIDVVSPHANLIGNRQVPLKHEPMGSHSPGTWLGLTVLILVQLVIAIPAYLIGIIFGSQHEQQFWLAGAVVWPWVIFSYLPLLIPSRSTNYLVPIYLSIMIRMFGTMGGVLVVRQIAAPLAPNPWFAYIFAFYFAGLTAETVLLTIRLNRRPG